MDKTITKHKFHDIYYRLFNENKYGYDKDNNIYVIDVN